MSCPTLSSSPITEVDTPIVYGSPLGFLPNAVRTTAARAFASKKAYAGMSALIDKYYAAQDKCSPTRDLLDQACNLSEADRTLLVRFYLGVLPPARRGKAGKNSPITRAKALAKNPYAAAHGLMLTIFLVSPHVKCECEERFNHAESKLDDCAEFHEESYRASSSMWEWRFERTDMLDEEISSIEEVYEKFGFVEALETPFPSLENDGGLESYRF